MVRVKNRYLVVNYLYPTLASPSGTKDALPEALSFHQPTPDEFHQGRLIRAIQDGVTELFGDYGMGMVSTSLKGKSSSRFMHSNSYEVTSNTCTPSKLPLNSDFHLYNSLSASALRDGMGRPHIHDSLASPN